MRAFVYAHSCIISCSHIFHCRACVFLQPFSFFISSNIKHHRYIVDIVIKISKSEIVRIIDAIVIDKAILKRQIFKAVGISIFVKLFNRYFSHHPSTVDYQKNQYVDKAAEQKTFCPSVPFFICYRCANCHYPAATENGNNSECNCQ